MKKRPASANSAKKIATKFIIGDKVLVMRKAKSFEQDWTSCWSFLMDKFIGKTMKIIGFDDTNGYICEAQGENWRMPWFILKKVGKK